MISLKEYLESKNFWNKLKQQERKMKYQVKSKGKVSLFKDRERAEEFAKQHSSSVQKIGENIADDVIRGTFEIAGDTLIVNVHDVEDRIDGLQFKNFSTGEVQTSKIRVRAQMERLLRKMGYDVEAPGKRGKLQVQILWPDATGREQHEFKLIPKPFNAAFARQPRSVQ